MCIQWQLSGVQEWLRRNGWHATAGVSVHMPYGCEQREKGKDRLRKGGTLGKKNGRHHEDSAKVDHLPHAPRRADKMPHPNIFHAALCYEQEKKQRVC